MADDVILCASELAANAAIHSRSRLLGGTFTVRAKISPGDYAWTEAEDDGGPTSPGIRDATGQTATRILTDEQLADYQPWFDNHRRLRELIAELEALSLAITEADPRWER